MKKFTLILSLLLATVYLQAQDYQISFAGTGASTNVGTVIFENLTQGKSISLSGSEVLHLVTTGVGITKMFDNENALRIYPNPATNISKIDFVATASGRVNIELFDIAGRRIGAAQNTLTIGNHSYQVSGLRSGIYTVRITSPAYTYTGKLISNGAPNSDVKISYLGYGAIPVTAKMLKSTSTETTMQYTAGDRLKITGTSGNYSTVVIDIPTQSKTLTFTFIACTDGDGNNYPVVQIGTQFWMAENLKTTKDNDGTSIPNVIYGPEWVNLTTPGFCWPINDIANKDIYGALYNWYTVNTGKLAPLSWHVPTDAEWTTLTNYLGGSSVAGGKLKETGSYHWMVTNNNEGTNESGFTALPGGSREDNASFIGVGFFGDWWSASEVNETIALLREIGGSNNNSNSNSFYRNKKLGLSVRCLWDVNIPTLNTTSANSITSISAICGGNITYDGGANVTERGICYNTNQNPTINDNKIVMDSQTPAFSATMSGLTVVTTYYVRAYATNSAGTGYGNVIVFTTSGTVTDTDGNVYHTVTIGTQVWMVEDLKTTKFNDGTNIPNVTDNTAWLNTATPAYCFYNNDIANKEIYGALYNMHTVNTGKLCPTGWHVPTDAEWTILTNFLGGETGAGGKLKEEGITHWTSPNTGATNETGFIALPGGTRSNTGSFSDIGKYSAWWSSSLYSTIGGWYRNVNFDNSNVVKANKQRKTYGLSVRCLKDGVAANAIIPTVNTIAAGNITSISATSGGNITSDGGAVIISRGVCWNTTFDPTILDNKTTNGNGPGSFTSNLTNLTGNKFYYIRAYATNSVGTAYGNLVIITTIGGIPVVSTSAVTSITPNSVICGGNIINDGGAAITELGVCYSISPNPTINNNKMAMGGSGKGIFSDTITGLVPNTTYYLRAYATNSIGTGYGNAVSFKKITEGNETVTDIDGNVYHTVTIGTQVWMVENLRTTKYRNGDQIPNVTDDAAWAGLLTNSAFCYYNNDVNNGNTYGCLYNWYSVNDIRKIAPTGWHVASDAEWTTLGNYLGGSTVAGGKLKESGTSHWVGPNTGATNESSFTGLPGGYRRNDGPFGYEIHNGTIGLGGFWWSSSAVDPTGGWGEFLNYNGSILDRAGHIKSAGYSVRCVKD